MLHCGEVCCRWEGRGRVEDGINGKKGGDNARRDMCIAWFCGALPSKKKCMQNYAFCVLCIAKCLQSRRWKLFTFVVQTCANNIRGLFIFINVILFLNFQGGFSLLVIKPVQIL